MSKSIFLAAALAASMFGAVAHADETGVVVSRSPDSLVVRTDKAVAHYKLDAKSKVTGEVVQFAWVSIDADKSGHINSVKSEELPMEHVGTVTKAKSDELDVKSSGADQTWNIKGSTVFTGVGPSDLGKDDVVEARIYKNHNIAELHRTKVGKH